jgi:PTS system ascorbate-specific IIC component
MQILIDIWSFFQTNILTKPAFFVGLIVLIGYMLLRKPFYQSISGFIKAVVGYLILIVGASGLTNNFRPILAGLNTKFNLSAVVIDPYFGQTAALSAVEAVGRSVSNMMLVLVIAFLFNILLVAFHKITKIRSVFITGHIMVQQSATALWIFLFCFPNVANTTMLIILGFVLGTYWAVASNLTVDLTQNLTGGANFAVGHQQMFGIWLADKVGEAVARHDAKHKVNEKGEKKERKLPAFMSMFDDNVVATGVLMMLFFGIIMVILGRDLMTKIDPNAANGNYFFYILEKSLNFAVYLTILKAGVQMFVSELSVSFTGISEKLLPGSIPAIDCAATYGFGDSNTLTYGFLFGAIGQFIAILGLIVFKSPVLIITGFIPVFFDNATFALFAAKKGGNKAILPATFASGIIQVLLGAVCAGFFKLAQYGGWHGNFDMSTVWLFGGVLMKYLGYVGVAIIIVALLIIPQIQYRKNKDTYFLITEDYEEYLRVKAQKEAKVAQ